MMANINISVENTTKVDQMAVYDNASQEIVDVLQKIVQHVGALIEVQQCSIALLDAHGSALVTLAALGERKLRRTRFELNEGVAGWVAAHREPLVIHDVELDARFKRLGRSPVGSMICVPLLDADRFIGTITASSVAVSAFDESKTRLLVVFAEQAVLAITNARYAKQADRYASQLELLLDFSHGMTTRLEPPALYETILSDLRRLVPCMRVTMYRYHETEQELDAVATQADENAGIQDVQRQKIPSGSDDIVAWAALHRHPMVVAATGESQAEALIAAPLVSKNIVYGVLLLQRRDSFNSEELRLVRNVSNIAATAVENMELLRDVRADREQLHAILRSISDGIALIDSNGTCIEANAAFGLLLGIEPERAVGMEYMEIFEGDAATSAELRQVQQALQRREALPYMEFDLDVQDASHALGIIITPVTMAQELLSLVVVRDVTAIRDATRMKANFLSMITHELRSPLNAINGYLDLSLEGVGGDLDPQLREFLQRARAGSEHLYALIEDLLLVSRADAGQLRLNRQVMNVQQIVENTIEELELTATDRNIEVSTVFPTGFPRLYADPIRLQQVLRNLLSNALRFTESGGRITLAGEIERTGESEEDEPVRIARLTVSDTGPGIAPEHQQRIFERFYQVPHPGSRTSGQGLGLAIVKMIVELHGGQVIVESAPGRGSTFICTFPCVLS